MDQWPKPPPSSGPHFRPQQQQQQQQQQQRQRPRQYSPSRPYYGDPRQQQQQGGGSRPPYSQPPQQYRPRPPLQMRRHEYPRREGYYEAWQDHQMSPPPPPHYGGPPRRAFRDERPYMPMYDEMRYPEREMPPHPQQQVRIQFRPNQGGRGTPRSTKPVKKAEPGNGGQGEQKDRDSLDLLAKVSFAMQTSPKGPSGEQGEDKQKQDSPKQEDKEEEAEAHETPPQKTREEKLPKTSPVAVTGPGKTPKSEEASEKAPELSPVTPEQWTPKTSNQSPDNKRTQSGGSGRSSLTPLITPASSRSGGTSSGGQPSMRGPPGRTPHRRDMSMDYHRWNSAFPGEMPPHTPQLYPGPHGPPPPPAAPGDYARDYYTMDQIATPPDVRTAHPQTTPTGMQGTPSPPRRYPIQPPRGGREGADYQYRRDFERYPPGEFSSRGGPYEEEGMPPYRPSSRFPEAWAERGYVERYSYPEGYGGQYDTPPRSTRAGRYPPQHYATAVTPGEGPQLPPPPQARPEGMPEEYFTAPYTYVQQPRLEEKTVLRKKFSWKHYPELERFLISNRDEYLRHSALNYTAEQKQYNNWLTERLLEVAARHNYEFDPEEFNFVAVRDRIRCYYKSYVQTARKRGLTIYGKPATKKAKKEEGKSSSPAKEEGGEPSTKSS